MVVKPAPSGQRTFAQYRWGVAHTHLLQNIESRVMHTLDIRVGQWLVGATLE
jgi:hypothetical protein